MFDTFVDFIKNKGTIDIINYKPWLYVAKIDKTNNIIINQLKEIGLLIGIGAFVSGQVIRFRPKTDAYTLACIGCGSGNTRILIFSAKISANQANANAYANVNKLGLQE